MNKNDKPISSDQAYTSSQGFGPGDRGDFDGASGLLFE